MKRIRCMTSARSQGKPYTQRQRACPVGEDVHRRAFAHNAAPGVDARGSTPREAVKALIEATGLSPRLSVCGRPFCLDDADGADDMEGGCATGVACTPAPHRTCKVSGRRKTEDGRIDE